MSNKPKFGPRKHLGVLEKVDRDRGVGQLRETLLSIQDSAHTGKLKNGPLVHDFFAVTEEEVEAESLDELSCATIASLLHARLVAQGYVLYYDPKQAQKVQADAMARLNGLLPTE